MMKRMIPTSLCAMAIALASIGPTYALDQSAAAPAEVPVVEIDATPRVQIAILLDTSGSMSGLIEQAKTQLWQIVNQFATATRNGKRPRLTVALYEYGKSSIPASEQHLRMILPLTDDLDKVSEELFALRTNGGEEYCGTVIQAAVRSLQWSGSNQDYKAIFIAGNEPFTQGGIDYRQACRDAITKGVIVNTIFCGAHDQGIATQWKDGAMLADGSYASIDQNRKVVAIAAPQDKELAALGQELNGTYLAYGKRGRAGAANQIAQDSNSSGLSPSNMASRAATKASAHYRNGAWDLVDALETGAVKLDQVKQADLPKPMQGMTPEQRKDYLEAQTKKRAELQAKIQKLAAERKKYIAQKRRETATGGQKTLDEVMISTISEQAAKKSFQFAE